MSLHLEKCTNKQCGYVFLIECFSAFPGKGANGSGVIECPHCGMQSKADIEVTYLTRPLPEDVKNWPEEGRWH